MGGDDFILSQGINTECVSKSWRRHGLFAKPHPCGIIKGTITVGVLWITQWLSQGWEAMVSFPFLLKIKQIVPI